MWHGKSGTLAGLGLIFGFIGLEDEIVQGVAGPLVALGEDVGIDVQCGRGLGMA